MASAWERVAAQALLQEPEQARREKPVVAVDFVHRVPDPIVRRAFQNHRPREIARLLEREQERLRLRGDVYDVVLRTPDHKEGGVIVLRGDIGQRRSIEVGALVIDGGNTEVLLHDGVARPGQQVVLPLLVYVSFFSLCDLGHRFGR